MATQRSILALLMVAVSVFTIWEAYIVLDSWIFCVKMESKDMKLYSNSGVPAPSRPIFYDVETTRSAIDVPTKSSSNHIQVDRMDMMLRQENKFAKRRLRVEAVCEKYKDMWINKHVGKEFLFDLDNKLAYCRHGKASGGYANPKVTHTMCACHTHLFLYLFISIYYYLIPYMLLKPTIAI